jgi:putative addiction module component (TIGR02574 family)
MAFHVRSELVSTRLAEMTDQVLALPPADRLAVALRLWESLSDVDRAEACPVDPPIAAEVRRRDEELSSGAVAGRSHEEVMAAARKALRCR